MSGESMEPIEETCHSKNWARTISTAYAYVYSY